MIQGVHGEQLLASSERHRAGHQGHVPKDAAIGDECKAAIDCRAHRRAEKWSVEFTSYISPHHKALLNFQAAYREHFDEA
jgi:hypothetical protein